MPNGKRVVHCPLVIIWPNCLLLLRENRNFSLIYGIELLESQALYPAMGFTVAPVDLIDK